MVPIRLTLDMLRYAFRVLDIGVFQKQSEPIGFKGEMADMGGFFQEHKRMTPSAFRMVISALVIAASGFSAVVAAEPGHGVLPIRNAFESTVVSVVVMPNDVTVPIAWQYTNHWDFPLVIERFEESCGCLKGEANKEAVEPGKVGHIRAVMTPGAYRGKFSKSLYVRFVGHERPVEVVVAVTIASHVELSQRELVWKAGEKPEAKSIEIKSGTGKPLSITGLLGIPEGQFALATETIEENKHYRLSITPKSEAAGQHCLQVRTDSPDPRDSVQAVFLRVDKTPPTASDL